MNDLLVVFSHGKESGPLGSKFRSLMRVAERLGAQTLSLNYRERANGSAIDPGAPGEADRRVAQLLATPLPANARLVLVGSSMGGYVSTVASAHLHPKGMFLLAPAFYLPGYACQEPAPCARTTLIVHGWDDVVVPPEHSLRFARRHRCALHLLAGDHRLNAALPALEPLFEMFLHGLGDAGHTPQPSPSEPKPG